MSKKPAVLIIRDGWAENPGGENSAKKDGNAALLADTPYHDDLFAKYPVSRISASGADVGLPDGQMGNSEVGHLNLGAGRIVYQDLTRINKAIEEKELAGNSILKDAFKQAKGHRLHLIGLVSDGGVHSHQNHLVALAQTAKDAGCEDIMVHAITDGRDTSPTGGEGYVSFVEDKLGEIGVRIATVIGRYYAMDRDNRWERSKLAWDAIVNGVGEFCEVLPSDAIAHQYKADKTDEFLLPMIFSEENQQRVNDGDVILFFNFRADRARQLSRAFLEEDFDGFERGVWPQVNYVTLTEYDEKYDCSVVFPPEKLEKVLGEVVASAGRTQLRIAETEKYPHVTYFFNGGEEEPFTGEDRAIIPSPKVATYDLQPEMSADQVTDTVVQRIENYDMMILNYANPDMVGHTGDIDAAIKAVEKIDACVKRVTERVLELGGKLLITSDHGNCEVMRNPDGSPQTAHTTNLVPMIYVAADAGEMKLNDGILADIAPTLLDMMGVDQPDVMTGHSLLESNSGR
ncbi:MAG: 2,3-bisphosphoglycerate-independent phosphoglycerate mutase [Verrucomicrobiales bacterium]|nr:2,3-bisphosphoglycerate-independent phosphoglycerate mutase [Verrucomicrobiales bacterium]